MQAMKTLLTSLLVAAVAGRTAVERRPCRRSGRTCCDRHFGRNKLRPSRMESRHLGGAVARERDPPAIREFMIYCAQLKGS